jgi:hypothetical protein
MPRFSKPGSKVFQVTFQTSAARFSSSQLSKVSKLPDQVLQIISSKVLNKGFQVPREGA